jgi:DNA-binding transcriptional ArsR family regulator
LSSSSDQSTENFIQQHLKEKNWMGEDIVIKQMPFGANKMRALVDFKKHTGLELYDAYKRLAIFPGHETDVGAAIGILALSRLWEAGIHPQVVSRHLSEINYAGLVHLGMNADLWRINGSGERLVKFRDSIFCGTEAERSCKVAGAFDVQQRRISRFLLVSNQTHCVTTKDLVELYSKEQNAASFVVDGYAIARMVKDSCKGALFTIQEGDAE